MKRKEQENLTEQLMQKLRVKYEILDKHSVIEISPEILAAEVAKELDPQSKTPVLTAWAATLELRQLARQICAYEHEKQEAAAEAEQQELFDLQRRYPANRKSKDADGVMRDVYVLREHLTLMERRFNIQRLRSEAAAKNRHADALEAETEMLISIGQLSEPA